jgi:putative transposase
MKRGWIEEGHPSISVSRQCELIGLARSSLYYQPCGESEDNLRLMRLIDEEYTRHPFYGRRRMTAWLRHQGETVNLKRVGRLMREMSLAAICAKRNLSKPAPGHRIYPYLLRGIKITRVNQVWSTDITYIRMQRGFIYLVAIIDWYSRFVISWEVSTSLESDSCLSALDWALATGERPEIFNTDQGSQFTSTDFTDRLKDHSILISMDGRGRALDNVFVERLWRSVKYEEVYLNEYLTVQDAIVRLRAYFIFYNTERLHQALGYRTPQAVYLAKPDLRLESVASRQTSDGIGRSKVIGIPQPMSLPEG